MNLTPTTHPKPLGADLANADLLDYYRSVWPAFLRLRATFDGVSAPHFPRVTAKYASSTIRLAFVGQQTANGHSGWKPSPEEQAARYPDSGIVRSRRSSPFWRAARDLSGLIGVEVGAPLWANLVAVDVGAKRPPDRVRDASRNAAPSLLSRVLEAARPDAAVFFVGPTGYYASELRQQFPGIEVEQVEGHPVRSIARLRHPALPAVTIRSYHPGYLNRKKGGGWANLSSIAAIIEREATLPPEPQHVG